MGNTVSMKTDDNQVIATIVTKDKKGNSVAPVAVPSWSVSPDGVVAMTVSADGMYVTFVPVAAGSASVAVSVDGVSATGSIAVSAAGIATAELNFGDVS